MIDDAGDSPVTRALVERLGARYEPHPGPLGLNVARNTGVERSTGELLVFVDDDVHVRPGWLQALLGAARSTLRSTSSPARSNLAWKVFGSRGCGREGPPITSLDLGPQDVDTRYAWGANMAIRRSALERVGPFEVRLEYGGDEQEWQDRMRAKEPGARVLYVAGAALEHRRAGADAKLRSLARAAYARGRASRRFDAFRREAPSRGRELLTLGGCLGHVLRYRCPAGLVMVAHSAGRLRESLRGRPATSPSAGAGKRRRPRPHRWRSLQLLWDNVHAREHERRLPVRCERHRRWPRCPSPQHAGRGGERLELASGRRLRRALAARRNRPGARCSCSASSAPSTCAAQKIRDELLRSRHEVEPRTRPPGSSASSRTST